MSYKISIGIVGLPNVGKSTLFKHLTNQDIHIANYPFATIDPNIGIVPVPDERLEILSKLSKSKKTIPAVVEFYDIAGLVKGANQGEGLGNQFLSHIKEVKAILQVVRSFSSDEIVHVEGSPEPERDIEIIKTELVLKDLDVVEKCMRRLERDIRSGDKQAKMDYEILEELKKLLLKNEYTSEFKDVSIMSELQLLTAKPQFFLLNGKKEDVSEKLKLYLKEKKFSYISEDLSSPKSLTSIIQRAYEVLGLISFFTTGEDETRAWTIKKGVKAPEAAGVIHTDFEKKFIRAEVISTDKLIEAGGWNEAKRKGWIRLEGKEYVVSDGDIMVIRHG